MAKVNGFVQNNLFVNDINKEFKFYTEAIGLTVVQGIEAEPEGSPFAYTALLQGGNWKLALKQPNPPFVRPLATGFGLYLGLNHIAILFQGVDEVFERIKQGGGVGEQPAINVDYQYTNSKWLYVRDPEGNRIEIMEPLPRN